MKLILGAIVSLCFVFCQSCSSSYLTVQQEWIDQTHLASSFAHTPNPKMYQMEKGQMLTVGWDYPKSLFEKDLTMQLTIRFWDDTQKTFKQKIDLKRDYASYFFSEEKILTYRIDILTKDEGVLESWVHQLWTELISPESDILPKSISQ